MTTNVCTRLACLIAALSSTGQAWAQVAVDVEAATGAPFGIGRVTLRSGGDFRPNRNPRPPVQRGGRIVDLARRIAEQAGNNQAGNFNLALTEMAISERSGRAVYPVFDKRDRPILREFIAVPAQTSIFFLFQGDAPLELTVYVPEPQQVRVVPRNDPGNFDRLVRAWWRDFSAAADGRGAPKDFPPVVEEYLTDTLARRMRLPLPDRPAADSGMFQSALNLLLGTEAARQDMTRAILVNNVDHDATTEPLPQELPLPKPELLNPADGQAEPIAMHVPVECLYVRFGSFSNFLWLRHRTEEWGGQLRDVISERGLDYGLNDRMQRQLGLREGALAELLGDKVIADVAMIGTDTFLREGAAIGLLFQAKSSTALSADLSQQRLTRLKEAVGGKQEKLTIADRTVSFFSMPDNSLRSFYVADGDFHLVTTSRTIVEWFLATGAGKHPSLGASDEFRLARKRMPLSRNDTVFVYLSPQFFQNLLSPAYHIELTRRLRSAVEIELVDIAHLAAACEQKSAGTVEELITIGLLPEGFGARSDGSHLEMIGNELGDSLRGARGTFLPVPDVPIDKITPAEARDYQQFVGLYNSWGAMDPVMAAVRREPLSTAGLEKVVLDIEAAPLSPQHIEMLSRWLGPPTDEKLASVPGDTVAFEAVMRGGSFFSGGDHHLFGALRDADPSIALDPRAGLIARILTSQLRGLQGYLGAWPNPGFLRILGGDSNARPDPQGYTPLITGLWRRQLNNFTLLSFHPEILALVSPQLRFEKAPRPAQVWFRADDLSQSKLAPLINSYGFRQSRQITQGNTRFMNMLSEQLHVAPAEARQTAERLLEAKMVEPLGGEYELREFPGGLKTWVSTALSNVGDSNSPPPNYQFPALNWLRGVNLELRAENGLLAIHGEVIMPVETKPTASPFQLPRLPFGTPRSADQKPKPQGPAGPGLNPNKIQAPKPSGTRSF